MSRDIYQSITERFIEQLKKGTVPWQQPWMPDSEFIRWHHREVFKGEPRK